MKQADVDKYKALLMTKREEIVGKSRQREEIWVVQCNDLIETVQMAGDRDFAVRAMERESKSMVQIDAALKRIQRDEFGICLDCEEPISPKRLAAVPWAAYCLECQEHRDNQRAADSMKPLLAA